AWQVHNGRKAHNLTLIPEPVQLATEEDLYAVTALSQKTGAELIVLDTQARVSVGLEENSAKEMGQFIEYAEQLRRDTKACVLVVHHTTKNGETERGSGAIRG